MNIFTRNEYMSNKCSHEQYYSQFISDMTISTLKKYINESKLKKCIIDGEINLSKIKLVEWDNLPLLAEHVEKLRIAGDTVTLAGKVCIYKCAARKFLNENGDI